MELSIPVYLSHYNLTLKPFEESPDPRWASILINARKAKITVKGEDKELQRLSINSLVEILKENLPQELKEKNQSVLDNMQKA